ncbi:MAG TPA: hypothetical protein VK673_02435 [Chthoniobacterales bacterium]|nr:hypothetical protein [Chthoniobacterales bacterium]
MSKQQKLSLSDLRVAHRSARRQARLKRLLSPVAFADALQQPLRWHLFYDGRNVGSAIVFGFGTNRSWHEGPTLSTDDLDQPDKLKAIAQELFRRWQTPGRKNLGFGVIVHLADELGLDFVREDFENPELHAQAAAIIRENPGEVVADFCSDAHAQCRYYPLFSSERAVALRHLIRFLPALDALIDQDIKVVIHSAPVEALAVYLKFCRQSIEDKPHCFVFFYDQFTVLVPVHHGVLDLKVLPHRQQLVPPTFGDDLFAIFEERGMVESCVLILIPCGSQDPTLLFSELDSYARRNRKNAEGIEIQIPDSESFWASVSELSSDQAPIIKRPEFLSEYTEWFGGADFPTASGLDGDLQRFGQLCRQNYFPDDQQSREKRLSRSLAILMLALRGGRIGAFCLLVALGAWFGIYAVGASQNEALHILPDLMSGKHAELAQLMETKGYLTRWDAVLTPRSQAWSVMDFVLGLLPESHDLVCENVHYGLKELDGKPGVAPVGKSGFIREWVVDGTCNDQGRVVLARLQEAANLNQAFNSTASRLGDPSFSIAAQRTAKAVLREEIKAAAAPGSLPYVFRLVVTETLPNDDALALSPIPKSMPKAGGRP